VLNRGLAVFDELSGSVKDIKFLSDPMAGELRVGSNQAIAGGLLTAVLDRLSSQRPRVAIQVKLGDAATLHYHDLRERSVDVLFGRVVESEQAEDDVTAEVLFEDHLYIVAGNGNPWTRRRNVALKDLIDEPWTMPPLDSYAGSLIADAFRASGLKVPHITVAGYGIQLQSALLGTGRFLSALPGSFLRFSGKQLGLKPLPVALQVPPRPVGVVTLKNRTLSPLVALFIEHARSLSKPLASMSKAQMSKAHRR
jgi:DNA-binding transcriptional LysR family regulator